MNSAIPKFVSKMPTRIHSTRAPRRRSNSIGELNDKLTRLKSASSTRLKDIENLRRPVRPGLSRRSKSYGDLSVAITNKGGPVQITGTAAKGIKRQNAVSNEGVSKKGKVSPPKHNKVSKPAKPAPYDYKARFNLLLEKHKLMKESASEVQHTLSEKTKELEVANACIQNHSTQLANATAKITQLERECNEKSSSLKSKVVENELLKTEVEALRAQRLQLDEICNSQRDDLSQFKSTLATQSSELKALRDKCEELTGRVQAYSEVVTSYKDALQKAEVTRRFLHNYIQELKGNIRVFCRVRPADYDRLEASINYLSENSLEIKKSGTVMGKLCDLKTEFTFDRVYPPQTQQQEIFDELSQLVQSAIDGYHVCVFAYGPTGSGKTYTMQGVNNDREQGMIPRSITWLFELINALERKDCEYQIQASFLEIYNETVRDLLKPNGKEKLCIQYNEGKGVTVTNLTVAPVKTASELTNLMHSANTNRAVAVTDFNEHSSRSHAVTKIHIRCFNRATQSISKGSLNFVDLAGSESAKTSSCERLCETKNINKSLSALGSVMLALHNKTPHVPYRNSKLTYLLQSCLGGNSKALMILNVAPYEDCVSETMNSLRFATKVKDVKTECRRNKTYAKENESLNE